MGSILLMEEWLTNLLHDHPWLASVVIIIGIIIYIVYRIRKGKG